MYLSKTTLFDGRDMYRIFISQPEEGHFQVPKHVAVLYVVNYIHISTIK